MSSAAPLLLGSIGPVAVRSGRAFRHVLNFRRAVHQRAISRPLGSPSAGCLDRKEKVTEM
jgi:hypothetical protein